MEQNQLGEVIIIDDDSISNMITERRLVDFYSRDSIFSYTEPGLGIAHLRRWMENSKNKKGILLLDINMPYMNGWDFLDVVSKDLADDESDQVGVFILSSSVNRMDRERAKAHPLVKGYFEKPLSVTEFKKCAIGEQVA